MSDAPKRYLDDGPSAARELLSHAKSVPPLPLEVKAASAASVAKLAGAKAGSALALKFIAGGLLIAGLGAGSVLYTRDTPTENDAQVQTPPVEEPQVAAPSIDFPPRMPAHDEFDETSDSPPHAVAPVALEPAVTRAPRRRTRGSSPLPRVEQNEEREPEEALEVEDTLGAEVALLETARRNLQEQPSAALASVEEYRRLYPRGQFAAAAELLEIDALLRLGRRPEAVERARTMAERRPSSLYRDRLTTLVGEEALVGAQ